MLTVQPPTQATGDLYFRQKQNMKSIKKLEAEIDSIRFEPKSAMEFREAKKEEQRIAQRQRSVSEQGFRLKQKPEHQSHVLRGQVDAEKAAEREKLRQLQQQFAKTDEENPFRRAR